MRPGRAAALLLAASLVLSSCGAGGGGGNDEPVGDPRPGGSLVWQLPAEVSTDLNPLESSDPSATGLISGSVYGKLLDWRTGPDVTEMELEGDLAESWEVSEDGLTYTFHLRRDVTWHDVEPVNGRLFVADDVVATITAMKERGLQAYMLEAVRTVQAPDEHTVVLTLDRPFAPLLEYVAYHTFLMVPREGIEGATTWTRWRSAPGRSCSPSTPRTSSGCSGEIPTTTFPTARTSTRSGDRSSTTRRRPPRPCGAAASTWAPPATSPWPTSSATATTR
ncbi:hypothetical protein WY02_25150 [Pseudonocardia sp. AL041005-10]|nr:hypothetical protein WY02_25150 [Pseudonocardia sp. AL041005-10]